MNIRPEQPSDIEKIWAVNTDAFTTDAEASLVNTLRESGCPFFSLVAEEGEQIIGHILFTPVEWLDHDSDDQELKLSFTANRSDDILYPSSPMDALYDDSNIFNVEYALKNLSDFSKSLDVQYYSSDGQTILDEEYIVSGDLVDGTFYATYEGDASGYGQISFVADVGTDVFVDDIVLV